MKLKKLISVMLIGACVCSMAACGSKKEEKKIESADDLKDAKIGVQTGTTGDIYCSDDFGDDHVERFNKGADAVQALVKGKINAVVIDNEPAKAFVDANDGLKILETPYVEEDYAMCFKKGNTELEDKFNAAIKELKEDGTFDKIVGYYIDGTEEKGYESPREIKDLMKKELKQFDSDIYSLSIVNVIDPNEEHKYLKYIFAKVKQI